MNPDSKNTTAFRALMFAIGFSFAVLGAYLVIEKIHCFSAYRGRPAGCVHGQDAEELGYIILFLALLGFISSMSFKDPNHLAWALVIWLFSFLSLIALIIFF